MATSFGLPEAVNTEMVNGWDCSCHCRHVATDDGTVVVESAAVDGMLAGGGGAVTVVANDRSSWAWRTDYCSVGDAE